MKEFDPKEIGRYAEKYPVSKEELQAEGAQLPIVDDQGRDINHGMYGKTNSHYQPPHTEATKRKMSETRKGVPLGPFSDEHKNNISIAKQGMYQGKNNNNYKHGRAMDLKKYLAEWHQENKERRNAAARQRYWENKNQDAHSRY